MKSTTRHGMIALAALLILGITAAAWAQGAGPYNSRPPIWDRAGAAEELGLTADQLQALRETHDAFRTERDRIRAGIRTEQRRIDGLLEADTVNEAAVHDVAETLADLHVDLVAKRTEHHLAIRNILTTEQYRQLQELREEFRDQRRLRRDLRGGRGNRGYR